MASEILNLSALCRCCHIDGTFRRLDGTYIFNGQLENYSTMLIDCFGLFLNQPAIDASHTICDICIEKLRNALKFKKQVEECEKKFENYCKNENFLQSKMEIECSSDYEVTIKPEVQIKIEDSNCHNPNEEYPELDNFKESYTEEKFNQDDGIENTDVNFYLDIIPASSPPCLYHKEEPEPKEEDNEYKKNYSGTDTSKSSLIKKENINESGPESKESNQNEHNSKNTTDLKKDPYPCLSCKGTYKTLKQLTCHIKRQHSANIPKIKHSCRSCNGIYRTEKGLTLHMAKKHSVMTCTLCNKDFNSKQLWYNHHQNKHKTCLASKERVGQFVCCECGITVKRRSTLLTHKKLKHTNTEPKVYTCDFCKKNFSSRETIRKHIEWFHSGVTPIKKHMCDICGFTSKDVTNLRIHIDSVHKKLKPYKCNQCPKVYAANKQLRVHLRRHTGERPYVCSFCDRKFINYQGLKNHIARHHNPNLAQNSSTPEFKHVCKLCGKGFDKRSKLATHNWTHKGSKPYKCDVCGKDFISKYCYKRHLKLHESGGPERVPCEICNKTFSCKAPMQRHMRTFHDPEREEQRAIAQRVKCEVCKILVWDMERHILKKHSGNCYQCEFCPRSYSEKGTLNRHIKERHSGIDNSCKLCGKKYIKSRSLIKHMEKKHNSMQ